MNTNLENSMINLWAQEQEAELASKVSLTLTADQAEFLAVVLNWWTNSGVNYWSGKNAQEILNLLK